MLSDRLYLVNMPVRANNAEPAVPTVQPAKAVHRLQWMIEELRQGDVAFAPVRPLGIAENSGIAAPTLHDGMARCRFPLADGRLRFRVCGRKSAHRPAP